MLGTDFMNLPAVHAVAARPRRCKAQLILRHVFNRAQWGLGFCLLDGGCLFQGLALQQCESHSIRAANALRVTRAGWA